MTREEAIEVYNGLLNQKIKEAFEFFAPELAESEDERVRRELIEYLRGDLDDITTDDTDRWITWIEKQEDCILVPKSHFDPVGKPGVDGMKILEKQKWHKPAEVCYGFKGDPDPAGVWKPSEEMKQNYIRKEAILELLQGMIQSYKTKNGFPAGTLAAVRIETLETVISRIEEICKEEKK